MRLTFRGVFLTTEMELKSNEACKHMSICDASVFTLITLDPVKYSKCESNSDPWFSSAVTFYWEENEENQIKEGKKM